MEQKIQKVKQKFLIATVDTTEKNHVDYWQCYNDIDSKPFEFANTRAGFKLFWGKIHTAKIISKAGKIIVGLGSMGPYVKPLVHYLRKYPVGLVQVNPVYTKYLKELDDNSPLETNRKDSRVLANATLRKFQSDGTYYQSKGMAL